MGAVVRGWRWLTSKVGFLLGFCGIATLCGVLAAALGAPVVAALAYGTNYGAKAVSRFPAELRVPNLDGRTYVYDRTGGLIAAFFRENRVYVPITAISAPMQQAIVDIEDERFYMHGAADLRGTLRALASNAQGGSSQGGSTLTQQYVKNILINQATTPAELSTVLLHRRLPEKVRELQYSIALEGRLTKRQILEGYLNIAPFGRNVYGVEAASEYYFATTAARLTVAQAAMLAGEVQAPSLYDPTAGGTHVVQARFRRDVVLAKMYQLHHIPRAVYDAAVASTLAIHRTVPKLSCAAADTSPWYCDYVQKILERDPTLAFLGATAQQRDTRLNQGGLEIFTALDPVVARLADRALAAKTRPTDSTIVSTAIIKPGTGDVLAIANSKPFNAVTSSIDYAVPTRYGNSAGFQPGSGMKPITMAVALEKGLPLSYRITAVSGVTIKKIGLRYRSCDGHNATDPSYKLTNEADQSYGSITMLQGIWESVNSYFMQLEGKVGLCPVARLAGKLGITQSRLTSAGYTPTPLEQVSTLTLGTDITSPLQMSELYATLAARGVYCAPRVITRIVDVDANRTLYDMTPRCAQVIPTPVADAINWALYHDVQADLDPASTAHPALIPGIPTAGKTGTTDRHNAVWFNGYNAQFAASLMVARPSILKSVDNQKIGGVRIGSATGGATAGRIWVAMMNPILRAQATHPGFVRQPAPRFKAGLGAQTLQSTALGVLHHDVGDSGRGEGGWGWLPVAVWARW